MYNFHVEGYFFLKIPLNVLRAITKEILKDEKNMKEALDCKWIYKDKTSTTPFKELIKRMPSELIAIV